MKRMHVTRCMRKHGAVQQKHPDYHSCTLTFARLDTTKRTTPHNAKGMQANGNIEWRLIRIARHEMRTKSHETDQGLPQNRLGTLKNFSKNFGKHTSGLAHQDSPTNTSARQHHRRRSFSEAEPFGHAMHLCWRNEPSHHTRNENPFNFQKKKIFARGGVAPPYNRLICHFHNDSSRLTFSWGDIRPFLGPRHRILMRFFAGFLRKIISLSSPSFIIYFQGNIFLWIFEVATCVKSGKIKSATYKIHFDVIFCRQPTNNISNVSTKFRGKQPTARHTLKNSWTPNTDEGVWRVLSSKPFQWWF